MYSNHRINLPIRFRWRHSGLSAPSHRAHRVQRGRRAIKLYGRKWNKTNATRDEHIIYVYCNIAAPAARPDISTHFHLCDSGRLRARIRFRFDEMTDNNRKVVRLHCLFAHIWIHTDMQQQQDKEAERPAGWPNGPSARRVQCATKNHSQVHIHLDNNNKIV